MGLARYGLGLTLLAITVIPLVLSARAVSTAWLTHLGAAPKALAEAVLALCAFIMICELVGVVGAFATAPLVIACWAVFGLAVAFTRRRHPSGAVSNEASSAAPYRLIGILLVAAVTVQWVARITVSLDHGMTAIDTLWYHMPYAARFVHDGSLWHIPYLQADPLLAGAQRHGLLDPAGVVNFYPADSSLFHAAGLMLVGRDVLSPVLNLGWMALFLLAAFCIGAKRSVAWPTAAAGILLVAVPIMTANQPGEATNDVVGLALLVAAVALFLTAPGDLATLAVAGLATGAAVGTKLTFVAPAAALTILVIAFGQPPRRKTALVWIPALVATGGFWYLRNWVQAGSPIPLLHFNAIGLPGARLPSLQGNSQTVAHYLTDTNVWRQYFIPGLHAGFGPAWPVLIVLAMLGIALAIWRGERAERVVGVTAIAAIVAYLFTPQTAGGPPGQPGLFVSNLRFLTPGLAVGMLLAAAVASRLGKRGSQLVLGTLVIETVATAVTLARSDVWPAAGRTIIVAALVAGALAALAWTRYRGAVLAALTLGILTAGLPVTRHYVARRYATTGGLAAVFRWAQGVQDSRLAVAGFIETYPLYGVAATNEVTYLGVHGPHGTFRPPDTCEEWVNALRAGRYRYLVLTAYNYPFNPQAPRPAAYDWTRRLANASVILRPNPNVAVFQFATLGSAPRAGYRCPVPPSGRRRS